jgi:hypothetical protein
MVGLISWAGSGAPQRRSVVLLTAQALSDLVAGLYGAANNESEWSVFLRELAIATKGNKTGILLHDRDYGHTISLSWGFDPTSLRLYQQHYGDCDVWVQKAAPRAHAGWLHTSEEICPVEDLLRSEFYNDYLKCNDIAHAMWGMVENSESRKIVIGVYRDLRGQPFQSQDLELLRFLSPHLEHAFRLRLHLSELKARADAVNMLATGVIFLGNDRRIVDMNAAAGKILADPGQVWAVYLS